MATKLHVCIYSMNITSTLPGSHVFSQRSGKPISNRQSCGGHSISYHVATYTAMVHGHSISYNVATYTAIYMVATLSVIM